MTLLQRPAPIGETRWGGALSVAAVTAAGAIAAATLFAIDPNEPGHYPTCPFLALTGWYCPGCGSLRALHDLLHLDLAGAFARNPLTMLAVPYLLLAWLTWIQRLRGRPARSATSLPAWALWALLGTILAFGVLRNLPGWSWLSPA